MTKRILAIEDHEENRRLLRDLLTSVGYELIEAVTGEEGLTSAETHRAIWSAAACSSHAMSERRNEAISRYGMHSAPTATRR